MYGGGRYGGYGGYGGYGRSRYPYMKLDDKIEVEGKAGPDGILENF